jgi:dienelactone hydrolase
MFNKIIYIIIAISLSACANSPKSNSTKIHSIKLDNNETLPTAYFISQSEARPTIIVMHGCSGLVGSVLEYAKVINSWGYNAVVPDSLTGRNANTSCEADPLSGGRRYVGNTDRLKDLATTAEWVSKQPWHKGKIGAIGFSMGGIAVLNAATNGGLVTHINYKNEYISAVVAYYPRCYHENTLNHSIPIQIHIGKKDDWTSERHCRQMIGTENTDVNIYPNATHSFNAKGLNIFYLNKFVMKYDPDAAPIAEAKTKAFFEQHIAIKN